jgi:hypothetical protein
MTAFEERPHSPYFGSSDATPLFLVLLDEFERWSGKHELVTKFEAEARAALRWIDEYGDRDGDGYVEYERRNKETGIENQCWKDSWDSIVFSDGTLASFPTATCEIQGYVYDAKRRCSRLAREFWGDSELASRLEKEAAEMKQRFNRDFWIPEKQFFALALDGQKRKVDSLTSNIGHLLWSGIVDEDKAEACARSLVGPQLFSGWGVRTMADDEGGYNPIGYHVGTVWPFDNSLVALGLRNYGFKKEAGVAMGIKGTEVTKEAAGMILADDNFASIAAAVKEGRTVYNNIEKAMLFMLPTNVAQALVIAVAILFGFTLPITASQILWVNMVTSVALGLVISFEPHETDVMLRPPRAVDRPIVTAFGLWRILFIGSALLAYTLLAFFWMKSQGASDSLARTVAVNAITIGQIFYLLNSRYLLDSSLSLKAHMGNKYLPLGIAAVILLQLVFTYTTPFQAMFFNEAIPLRIWPWLLAGGVVFFLVVECEKLIIRSSDSLRRSVTAVEAGT